MLSKDQLDGLIEDVKDLGKRIRSIDNLISAIDNPTLQAEYRNDLFKLLENYRKACSILEQEIVAFSVFERENDLPINLTYRRILKSLREP